MPAVVSWLAGGLVRRAPLRALRIAHCGLRIERQEPKLLRRRGSGSGGREGEGRGHCQNGRWRPTAGIRDSGMAKGRQKKPPAVRGDAALLAVRGLPPWPHTRLSLSPPRPRRPRRGRPHVWSRLVSKGVLRKARINCLRVLNGQSGRLRQAKGLPHSTYHQKRYGCG